MKANVNKYLNVDRLPENAVSVKLFADSKGYSTSYVYKLIKLGKAPFDIVVWQGINWVVEK